MGDLRETLRRLEGAVLAQPEPKPPPPAQPTVRETVVRDPETQRVLRVECEDSDGHRWARTPVRDPETQRVVSIVEEPMV